MPRPARATPKSHALSTAAAHHPFAETLHRPTAIPDPEDVLAFAARMLHSGDMRPDVITFTVALVRQLHVLASRAGQAADMFVCNALVTAYFRGGLLDAARKVFDGMQVTCIITYKFTLYHVAAKILKYLKVIKFWFEFV
ncbi:hypothetical protein PVAP13_5KG305828 [Panicum virgatum]|uniref:Pentatricopeptide repeat-containing protein n=1 Tax=Panicum virgatum TaxID=38727 RepID=A0A8T0SN91_PANVG|nr:hypothetical protein PVAP13_5KG305828 [Panicum virgatum]